MRESGMLISYDGRWRGAQGRGDYNTYFSVELNDQTFKFYKEKSWFIEKGAFITLPVSEITAVYLRPSALPFSSGIEVLWTDQFLHAHQLIFGTHKTRLWLAAFRESGANVVDHPPPMKPWPAAAKRPYFRRQQELRPGEWPEPSFSILSLVFVIVFILGCILLAQV